MKRSLIVLLLLSLVKVNNWGQTPIINFNGRGSTPALLPGTPLSSSTRALRIEFLTTLPLPPGGLATDRELVLKKLGLIACSIHSMEGLEYWSASRGRMRTLYSEAYRVEIGDQRKVLADPASLADLPPGTTWHFNAFLRDLTFGANVLSYQVEIEKSSLTILSENVTPMRYLLLPLVEPGGLKTRITLIPGQEGLLLHFISTVDAVEIAAKRVFESAGNKSLAVLGWFARKAFEAGIAAPVTMPADVAAVPSHGGQ